MQSKAFVLFLSAVAFLAAPTLAVLGENDYLAAHDNVFNAHNLRSVENWHDDFELEAFLEGRVKNFIRKDFHLQGSSLAEKLEYLADTELFPLINEPLTDKKVLESIIKNVLISYKRKIFNAKVENDTGINEIVNELTQEVRDLVNRHITAIILETGKVPEEELKMDFKEIVDSVKTTTTEIIKKDVEKKESFKAYISGQAKTMNQAFMAVVIDINMNLKNYFDNASQFVSRAIADLHKQMATQTVPLESATDRMNALIDAAIEIEPENSFEIARLVNSLYWKSTSSKQLELVMDKILARAVEKVFKILIDKKPIDEVSQMFRDLVVNQYLAHGKDALSYSQTYCSYFSTFAERSGIAFRAETDSERETSIKILGVTDYLFSFATCRENTINEDDLRAIIKNISDVFLLDEKHRALIDQYPLFMKIRDIDVSHEFELIHTLHKLYINFRADNHFKFTTEGVLEAALDKYLDKVIEADSVIGTHEFRTEMRDFAVMLKIMILITNQLPEDHTVLFKNLGVDAYEKFAAQFNYCNFSELQKFVASLFPQLIGTDMKINASDFAFTAAFDDITLKKSNERVAFDEKENQMA